MAVASVLEQGNVSKGDMVVITAGHPAYVSGTTNMLKVKRVQVNNFLGAWRLEIASWGL